MRYFVIALLAAAFLLIYGCIQVSPSQQCSTLAPEAQPGCTYYLAVMDQNPYPCYSMANMAQREVCLKDAIDPAAKKALSRVPLSKAGNVLAGKVASSTTAPSPAPAPKAANATTGTESAAKAPLAGTPVPEENATAALPAPQEPSPAPPEETAPAPPPSP